MLGSEGSKSPSSPGGLLSRLDQLTLSYAKIAPTSKAEVGLGFDLDIELSNKVLPPTGKERRHSSISTYTPANTPACNRNKRRYSSFLAREASYNYEEDDVDPSDLKHEASEDDEADLLPMMGWLQDRLEEAARREEYENEMDADMLESGTLVDLQTAVLVQRKVVKVEVNRAIASLRRTESVLQTPPRAIKAIEATAGQEDRDVSSACTRSQVFSANALPSHLGTASSLLLCLRLAAHPLFSDILVLPPSLLPGLPPSPPFTSNTSAKPRPSLSALSSRPLQEGRTRKSGDPQCLACRTSVMLSARSSRMRS